MKEEMRLLRQQIVSCLSPKDAPNFPMGLPATNAKEVSDLMKHLQDDKQMDILVSYTLR